MTLLANLLTLSRIVLIPFIIRSFLQHDAESVLIMFVAASVTDYLDGIVARRLNGSSKFGRMLDPIADKMLVTAILIMLVYDRQPNGMERAPLILVMIIIMREILVSGLREFLAIETVVMPVTKLAKWKTTFQFLAILALLAAPIWDSMILFGTFVETQKIGVGLLLLATILTVVTGWQYFRHTMREAFRDAKVLEIKMIDTKE